MDPAVNDSRAGPPPPWHRLPELVLVKVFAYLGPRERLGAGLMCRRWLDALLAAPLWRSVRVQLCGGADGWDERAASVVLASPRYAPLVRRLELRWGRPSPATPASLAPALRLLEAARAAGQAGHLQLEQVQLRDLAHSHRAGGGASGGASQRGRLLAALATFLGWVSHLQMGSLC